MKRLQWPAKPKVKAIPGAFEAVTFETWTTRCKAYRAIRITCENKEPYTLIGAEHGVVETYDTYSRDEDGRPKTIAVTKRIWRLIDSYCLTVKQAMLACHKHAKAKGKVPKVSNNEYPPRTKRAKKPRK